MVILLDNGHGNNTPGKRSPDGTLLEYKYTREIVKKIYNKLINDGYKSIIIVPETEDIPLSTRTNRVNEICDKYGTENVILVSIHCNAASISGWKNARGWSAYTTKGKTQSDLLSEELYKVAINELKEYKNTFDKTDESQQYIRVDKNDGDNDLEENFWILRKSKCPAVLTENLFQDNKKDVKFLLSEAGKNAIVNIHVKGIKNYINRYK